MDYSSSYKNIFESYIYPKYQHMTKKWGFTIYSSLESRLCNSVKYHYGFDVIDFNNNGNTFRSLQYSFLIDFDTRELPDN